MRRAGWLVPAATVAIALPIAACGSSKSSSSSSSTSSGTTTTSTTAAKAATLRALPAVSTSGAKATRSSINKLPHIPKAKGPAAHIKGLSNQPIAKQVSALDGDLDQFYGRAFAASKLQWPQAQEAIVSTSPIQTQCSAKPTIAPTDPPLLCNNVFFWPVQWIQQNVNPQGGVVLAFVAAMMWGLHAEDVLGNTKAVEQGQMQKGAYGNQVMCFTGLYFRTISARNLFEPGDSDIASKFLSSVTGVPGVGAPDVTPQSLQAAFFAGYKSGSWSACPAK